jgi:hypothetical protein
MAYTAYVWMIRVLCTCALWTIAAAALPLCYIPPGHTDGEIVDATNYEPSSG